MYLLDPRNCTSSLEKFGEETSLLLIPSQEPDDPMAYIHFTAEGEVTFKSILFVPTTAPRGLFDEYGSKKSDFIKVKTRCL